MYIIGLESGPRECQLECYGVKFVAPWSVARLRALAGWILAPRRPKLRLVRLSILGDCQRRPSVGDRINIAQYKGRVRYIGYKDVPKRFRRRLDSVVLRVIEDFEAVFVDILNDIAIQEYRGPHPIQYIFGRRNVGRILGSRRLGRFDHLIDLKTLTGVDVKRRIAVRILDEMMNPQLQYMFYLPPAAELSLE